VVGGKEEIKRGRNRMDKFGGKGKKGEIGGQKPGGTPEQGEVQGGKEWFFE